MQSSKVESVRCIETHLRGCVVESVLAKDVYVPGIWGCNRNPLMCSVKTGSIVCFACFCAIVHTLSSQMYHNNGLLRKTYRAGHLAIKAPVGASASHAMKVTCRPCCIQMHQTCYNLNSVAYATCRVSELFQLSNSWV